MGERSVMYHLRASNIVCTYCTRCGMHSFLPYANLACAWIRFVIGSQQSSADRAMVLVNVIPRIFMLGWKSIPSPVFVASHPAIASALHLWEFSRAPDAFSKVCIMSFIISRSFGDVTQCYVIGVGHCSYTPSVTFYLESGYFFIQKCEQWVQA